MKRNKRISTVSLIAGYTLGAMFILMIMIGSNGNQDVIEVVEANSTDIKIIETNNTIIQERVVYKDRVQFPVNNISEHFVQPLRDTGVVRDFAHVDETWTNDYRDDTLRGSHIGGTDRVDINRDRLHGKSRVKRDRRIKDDEKSDVLYRDDSDIGLLDRRLHEIDSTNHDEDSVNIGNLTPDSDDRDDIGDIGDDFKNTTGKGSKVASGELYAYSFPSNGVGAGIGSGALGAGGGLGAGLSAGVGQGVMNGETVPTLGGVGSYAPPGSGAPGSGAPGSGTGGLTNGAGAGAAAGLMTGKVIAALGITAPGVGTGVGGGYNYDHLPKDGALHIMMHVDGSGSILNTRKQLDIMKDTLLKTALLPYYNNDEELYNRRVTIISSAGERTLKFFEAAAKKDNVLAIAFQDEAQPAYHLPNFNKQPEDFYLDDLNNLKVSLDGYKGVYRGVLFQVDRGKTFAKSFKEFVGNSFRGEGYLDSDNLKRYYRDNNTDNIRNKDGIVFSDEYHAKDSGDPQYYLDLIIAASKKIGLDLNTHRGGLIDGTYTNQQ
jgi:hypothetical protein